MINYRIENFQIEVKEVVPIIRELLRSSPDGNLFLNEIKDPKVLGFVHHHTKVVSEYLKNEFNLYAKAAHWGFRNETGNRVPAKGHVHITSEIILSSVTVLLGEGTWVKDENKVSSKEGETLILVEPKGFDKYPKKFKEPCLHGPPSLDKERVIFLVSWE